MWGSDLARGILAGTVGASGSMVQGLGRVLMVAGCQWILLELVWLRVRM